MELNEILSEKLKAGKFEVLLDDVANNRDEFVKIHSTHIGSSDVGAICGLNPFRSPMQVWAEMTGKVERKNLDDNDTVWMGHKLEPIIGELFARKTSLPVMSVNQVWRSREFPWAIFSPDFLYIDKIPGIMEAKSTKAYAKQFWNEDKAPDSAVLQLHWQLGHSGFEEGKVAGLLGANPNDFYHPTIKADEGIFTQIMDKVLKFRECVKKDIPPEYKIEDLDLIGRINGITQPGKVFQFPPEALRLFQKYDELREERLTKEKLAAANKENEDAARAELVYMMGDAEIGVIDQRKVTIKKTEAHTKEVNYKASIKITVK